jgi:hypothetical protein
MRRQGCLGLWFSKTVLCYVFAIIMLSNAAQFNAAKAQSEGSAEIWLQGGAAFLNLPANNFTILKNWTGSNFIRDFEDHNGNVHGYRIDGGVLSAPLYGGRYRLGVHGFYSWLDDDQNARCTNTVGVSTCGWMSPIDSPAVSELFVQNSNAVVNSHKDVKHGGAAVEVRRSVGADGQNSLKVGVAWAHIGQDTDINGLLPSTGRNMMYREDLKTNYYGGYIGFDSTLPLTESVEFLLSGDVGAYYADTKYNANWTVDIAWPFNGSGRISSDDFAAIARLRTEARFKLGVVILSLFAQGEYYSFVPKMKYNNNDVSGGGVSAGPQVGTEIGKGHGFGGSAGARVSLPL